MKTNRMSIEELKDLKPTYENPIELECDDGTYANTRILIKVVAIHNDRICYIDTEGDLVTANKNILKHYPSKKQQPKIETLYECISDLGSVFLFESGHWLNHLRTNNKSEVAYLGWQDALSKRKTGRSFKINMETGEIVE